MQWNFKDRFARRDPGYTYWFCESGILFQELHHAIRELQPEKNELLKRGPMVTRKVSTYYRLIESF